MKPLEIPNTVKNIYQIGNVRYGNIMHSDKEFKKFLEELKK